MKGSKSGSGADHPRGSALPVVLFLAVLVGGLVLLGVYFSGQGQPASQGAVYGSRFVKPQLSPDGEPPLVRRSPSFEVLVGTSRKKARWVSVGAVQYVSCDKGDGWTGKGCVSPMRPSGTARVLPVRTVLLAGLGGSMLLLLLVGLLGGGSRERV